MADEGQPQQQSIDLSVLSLEQLNQMKTKHEEEVQALSNNFVKLRDAQARFSESISAVETLKETVDNKEILVPLTRSLYVPGRIVEPDKMLVDVGTGYYVEKDQKKTVEFLERKKAIVETNLESLRNTIDLKRKNLEMIVSVMRRKIADIEAKRAEFRGGKDGSAVATA
ncbi:unnamed protein product [Ascophyllum nodosum]